MPHVDTIARPFSAQAERPKAAAAAISFFFCPTPDWASSGACPAWKERCACRMLTLSHCLLDGPAVSPCRGRWLGPCASHDVPGHTALNVPPTQRVAADQRYTAAIDTPAKGTERRVDAPSMVHVRYFSSALPFAVQGADGGGRRANQRTACPMMGYLRSPRRRVPAIKRAKLPSTLA